MKIVFFGGRHTVEILTNLNSTNNVLLVLTTDKMVINSAISQKIPYAKVLSMDEKIINAVKKIKPDLGIIADFGLKIPEKLINAFPNGIINIHPSLLPKYRGPTPVQSAILNGDQDTGITFIKIDNHIDHGPILHQEDHKISLNDDSEKVYAHLFKRAALIMPEVLKQYESGDLTLFEQEHDKATFTKIFKKEDGYINLKNPPGKIHIKRMINALHPWPGAWTKYKLGEKEVIVKFHPGDIIHVEGKRPMSYKDFVNGYEEGKILLKKLNLL